MISRQYKVYMTTRLSENIYGEEVEISAQILNTGIKAMKKSIDSSDYEIGVYTYGDISLKVTNYNGEYNDETDGRSLFPYSRDLTKIRIVYKDNNGEYTRFRGLINDVATKQNIGREEVEFRVLSLDSVIKTTKVSGGLINDNSLASTAIKSILNQTGITRVLNYNESNINVDVDFTIDVGSYFDNNESRKSLNELLFFTNSVLLIDSSDNIIVQSRKENSKDTLNLYGAYDEKNRQNIIDLKKYNNGKHRTFTSVKIEGIESTDNEYVLDYGFKQLVKKATFITNESTKKKIGDRILLEFKKPMIELEVTVETETVKNSDLLDRVSLNYPMRIVRHENKFLPIVGVAKIGDSLTPLPESYGNISISPAIAFKIIEISENPKSFQTTLKLRQYGWLSEPASSIIGFGRIGEAVIGS